MKDRDLAFLLDRSPVLEVLTIIASQTDVRLCLPGQHQLQIGDTVIEAATNKLSPTSVIIIPSIQTLALDVNFDISNDVKTLPAFIKCFPNIQTLHIRSLKTDQPTTGKINLKFWQKACPVQCVQHVRKLVIHEFQGKENERAFIKSMGETVKTLERLENFLSPQSNNNDLDAKMKPFTTVKWANENINHIDLFPSNSTLGVSALL
ncbi:hypothetical protein PR202_ga16959 [Eleusine coracana subsp. coracana]|uniref:F-box/LRR-repeat protein 15/At3g58940/PEG3-like LRR domain-containing protein n=1 Tax=Eleusine coracana subsp. coracana TaxID=191504 RepID=A0AAV5CP21_ELECO|nr:hypothetical protein PR202_ga16959 [Eleusine coracana subsp. coracana]